MNSLLIGKWEGRPEDKAAIDAYTERRRQFLATELKTVQRMTRRADFVNLTDEELEAAINQIGPYGPKLADHFGVTLSRIHHRCERAGISLRDRKFLLWAARAGI